MEKDKKGGRIDKRPILLIWVVACGIAAFYIPHYDFGFDGIKVWFYLCLLMLAGMLGGASFFQSWRSLENKVRRNGR